jgi:Fe-S cluster assembly protein SufB
MRKSVNPFSQESIEKLSAEQGEPSWMTELRIQAWKAFEAMPADQPKVAVSGIQAYAEPPRAAVPSENWPKDLKYAIEERGDEEGLIIQRDSTILSRSLTKDMTKKGVFFTDLSTALRLVPEKVRKYFGRQVKWDDPYAALNTAFWKGGSFLYVPEHVIVPMPFHICYWMTTPHSAVFPRTLIVAEKGSTVSFVDDFLSVDWDQDALAASAIELYIREDANVTYKQIHHWGRGVRHENKQMSSVASNGKLNSTYVSDPRAILTLENVAELYPEVRV